MLIFLCFHTMKIFVKTFQTMICIVFFLFLSVICFRQSVQDNSALLIGLCYLTRPWEFLVEIRVFYIRKMSFYYEQEKSNFNVCIYIKLEIDYRLYGRPKDAGFACHHALLSPSKARALFVQNILQLLFPQDHCLNDR